MNRALIQLSLAVLVFSGLVRGAPAQEASDQGTGGGAAAEPRTVAEASGFERTSRLADVEAFLAALKPLPHANRLRREVLGTTLEGRELPLVVVALEPPTRAQRSERLRVVCTGNIHAGEVEGKEAVQALLREFAQGQHAELLEHLELWFVPVFNGDGNEAIDVTHRETQNGPVGGVGTRANSQELDLNRDFIKAETREVQALIGLWNALDPHVFIDLHTTNGSAHGYHLTYSPSLSTNADPDLDAFAREVLFPEVTAKLEEERGLRVQHYGNFGGGEPRSWSTYDHRPRFGTNAFGLRGRLAILSEAYSYLPFQERVEVTHAFVLQVLKSLAGQREALAAACAEADRRVLAGEVTFGRDSHLVAGELAPIAVGAIEEVPLGEGRGSRRVATDALEWETMRVRVAFESRVQEPLPEAWVVLQPSEALVQALRYQGVEFEVVAEARPQAQLRFEVKDAQRSRRPFQGHHEVQLSGDWVAGMKEIPKGALWVPARQRLGRLAAQLLEPLSEDSLCTWNYFDGDLGLSDETDPPSAGAGTRGYWVTRVESKD